MHKFWRTIIAVFLGISAVFFVAPNFAGAAPLLANYFLSTLPTDSESIRRLSKNDVLVISPEQAIVRRDVINQIKRLNPDIILFAYVPSQSYNSAWQQYPANTLYGNLAVKDEWWLRDTSGNIVSDWPGLRMTNMSSEWSDYLINLVQSKILSAGVWDGIFWDMVYEGVSSKAGGYADLNSDGSKDDPHWMNAEWINRVNYLLQKSLTLNVKYVLINGSSDASMQKSVNGRMYETFPTPWEKGGSWSGIMNGLKKNMSSNRVPQLYIFNANTNNSGNNNNYKKMRFGLASSLLLDNVYFSFDFGDQNHAQTWWYDEYDINLGKATGLAKSSNNYSEFADDVWRREYNNGIALVNVTGQSQNVDLGVEYEKIKGTQDASVNDGSITDQVTLGAKDGLIMLKTYQTTQSIKNVVFKNGSFLRFYNMYGKRARNGFFAYEESAGGGAKLFYGDIDGDGADERIFAIGPNLQIFNSKGERWLNDYPFDSAYKGELRVGVGKLYGGKEDSIVVTSPSTGKAIVYSYYGSILEDNIYPYGKKYKGGMSVAIGDISTRAGGEVVFASGKGVQPEIVIYDNLLSTVIKRFKIETNKFKGTLKITSGDVNGDKQDEIIVAVNSSAGTWVKIYNAKGKELSKFKVASTFTGRTIEVGSLDVNFDGRDEVVVMNGD